MNAVPTFVPSVELNPSAEIHVPANEVSDTTAPSAPVSEPRRRRPRVWTVFATVLAAVIAGEIAIFVASIAVGVGMGAVMGAQGMDAAAIETQVKEFVQKPLPALLLLLIPCQLGMLSMALLAAKFSSVPFRERLGLLPPTGRPFGLLKLMSLASFTLSMAMSVALGVSLLIGLPSNSTALGNALQNGNWWALTVISVVISVIPGLVEEILFRGYMQRRFLERWSPSVAILATTVVFALLHCDSIQHILGVVPFSLIIGLLAHRTNSIKPGMWVHAMHNAGVVAFGAAISAMAPLASEEVLGIVVLGMLAAMALVGLPAVISLVRRPRSVSTTEEPFLIVEPLKVAQRNRDIPNFLVDSTLTSRPV